MTIGDYFSALVAFFSWIIGVFIGAGLERSEHRPYCDCERCKAWRQKMAERGKKQESK